MGRKSVSAFEMSHTEVRKWKLPFQRSRCAATATSSGREKPRGRSEIAAALPRLSYTVGIKMLLQQPL